MTAKSGYLYKRGEVNKSWKARCFVLQDDKLYYFKHPNQGKPINAIPLDQVVIRLCPELSGKEHAFEVVTRQRIFQLCAKSRTDMLEWMKNLSSHTVLPSENELINQAEEMIAKATMDKFFNDQEEILNMRNSLSQAKTTYSFSDAYKEFRKSRSQTNSDVLLAMSMSMSSIDTNSDLSQSQLLDIPLNISSQNTTESTQQPSPNNETKSSSSPSSIKTDSSKGEDFGSFHNSAEIEISNVENFDSNVMQSNYSESDSPNSSFQFSKTEQ